MNVVKGTNRAAEQSRSRLLTQAEIRTLWHGLPQGRYGDIVRLLLLTAQKRQEVFPCLSSPDPRRNKRPATRRGFLDALHVEPPEAWQLVGVRAGAESGVDCLDIDPDGVGWYDQNFDALPLTRSHATERGCVHLLFRHAEGLRCSEDRIAPGIDVRADGGFIPTS